MRQEFQSVMNDLCFKTHIFKKLTDCGEFGVRDLKKNFENFV